MKRCFSAIPIYFCVVAFSGSITQAFLLPTQQQHQHLIIIKGRDSANESSSSVCKQENGQFADPNYCDKYYDCWEGRPVSSGQCSHGLMFNEATSSCDYPSNVNCDGKDIAHPQENLDEGCEQPYGTFASPRHCAEYTVCHAGIASRFRCNEGLAFDKETSMCGPPHNPYCLETNLPNDRPEGENVDELPLDPDMLQPAPAPGGSGDGTFPLPDWPKFSKCPSSSSNGFFPVAKDCQAVVVCIAGKGFLFNCPRGHYYHPRDARCKMGRGDSCEQMKIQFQPLSVKSSSFGTGVGATRYAFYRAEYPLLPH